VKFYKRKEGLKDTIEFTHTSIIGEKTKKTRTRTYPHVNDLPMIMLKKWLKQGVLVGRLKTKYLTL
jgi:hypothetical protein